MKYLIVLLLLNNCTTYPDFIKPKFNTGDCYLTVYENCEKWDECNNMILVLEVGVKQYRVLYSYYDTLLRLEYADTNLFINNIDYNSQKVKCTPKLTEQYNKYIKERNKWKE